MRKREFRTKAETRRFEENISECRSYCKCGCSITFAVKTDKIVCRWCGRTAYNNSLARFKKIMKELSEDDNNTNYITNN